jgi:hypothetical protein
MQALIDYFGSRIVSASEARSDLVTLVDGKVSAWDALEGAQAGAESESARRPTYVASDPSFAGLASVAFDHTVNTRMIANGIAPAFSGTNKQYTVGLLIHPSPHPSDTGRIFSAANSGNFTTHIELRAGYNALQDRWAWYVAQRPDPGGGVTRVDGPSPDRAQVYVLRRATTVWSAWNDGVLTAWNNGLDTADGGVTTTNVFAWGVRYVGAATSDLGQTFRLCRYVILDDAVTDVEAQILSEGLAEGVLLLAMTDRTAIQLEDEVRLRADLVGNFRTTTNIRRYLTQSCRALCRRLAQEFGEDWFDGDTTITTTPGQQHSELSGVLAAAWKIKSVAVTLGDTRWVLPRATVEDVERYALGKGWSAGTPPMYRIAGNRILWSPTPTAAHQVTVRYSSVNVFRNAAGIPIPALNSDSDYFPGRFGWEEWAVLDAAIKVKHDQEQDTTALQIEKESVERDIVEDARTRVPLTPMHVRDSYRQRRDQWGDEC